jgi:hypothetical protein
VSAVKRAEIVSDRISHITMRVGRCDLALIVRAPTVNSDDDSKDNFYEQLQHVFDHFPTYHMQILLGCCKAKFGIEDIFKLTAGKYHIIYIKPLRKCENIKGQ